MEEPREEIAVKLIVDGAMLKIPAGIDHFRGIAGDLPLIHHDVISLLQPSLDPDLLERDQDAVAHRSVGGGDAVIEGLYGNHDAIREIRGPMIDGPTSCHSSYNLYPPLPAHAKIDIGKRLIRSKRDRWLFPLVESDGCRRLA